MKQKKKDPFHGGKSHMSCFKKIIKNDNKKNYKNDINTWLAKAWTAIDSLSVIWKSDRTDKIKHSCFQAAVISILLFGWNTKTLTKRTEKKLDSKFTRMLRAVLYWRQHRSCTGTYHPSRKLSKFDKPDMWDTVGEVRKNS